MANVDLTRFELMKLVMRERFGDPVTLESERRQPSMQPSDEQLRRQEVLRSIRS